MGCNDSLEVLHNAARDGTPIMVVHRVTGGVLACHGDLQLIQQNVDTAEWWPVSNGEWRLRFHQEQTSDGHDVYRIQTHIGENPQQQQQYWMAVNKDYIPTGIQWPDERHDSGDDADAQRWHIVPACEGGVALVPHLARTYALGSWQMVVFGGCVRPRCIYYSAYIPLGLTWEITWEQSTDIVQATDFGR